MTDRKATCSRDTSETRISVDLNIDGSGSYEISTGIGFLDHMLELFTKHGLFDLKLKCDGDLGVDSHHSIEDIAIALGDAFKDAAGKKTGIRRYGSALITMDEALIRVALDLSGRPFLVCETGALRREEIRGFPTDMVEHFFRSFSTHFAMNLHIDVIRGEDSHHIVEGIFKAVTRALRDALTTDPRQTGVPSTKGLL